MTKKRNTTFCTYLGPYAAAFVMVIHCLATSNEKPQDQWQMRENLVMRLDGELYKVGVLKKELQSMQEILQDLRDIELFPVELTRASEESLVLFDKKIEVLVKKHQALVDQVEGLRPPLIDAMAILREMVIGQPVEDMFQVLDNDDIRRISSMFTVKHHIDSLWRSFEAAFAGLAAMVHMRLPEKEETRQVFDEEFFEILKASIGQLPERYYRILNVIKDTLFNRGNDDLRGRMFQVETHRIKLYLKTGNAALAKMKLSGIRERYAQGKFVDEYNVLFIKACFALGNYEEALETIHRLPDSIASTAEMAIDKAQTLFFLKRYDDLWKGAIGRDYSLLNGSARNLMLWLIMESGLAIGTSEKITLLASQMVKDSGYALHVMHCLGRYYVKTGDWTTAQSVFESALRLGPLRKIDREASQRILLTLAQTYYERGNYRKALSLFFNLLNHEACFAEALFGISWCYLGLGDEAKAETSLRKLINQNPWSPLSAEALLIIMQRYAAKARYEWEKYCYLTNEEQHLADRRAFIVEKMAADTNKKHTEEYRRLTAKIDELLLRLKNENRCSHDEIASFYDKAGRTAHLIEFYYATGTFQEISFSEKREKLLRRLDSLLLSTKDAGNAAAKPNAMLLQSKRDAAEIKRCVRKSQFAATEALIDQFRWEREYVEWQKTAIKHAKDDGERKLKSIADSAQRVVLALQQYRLTARMDSLVKAGDEANKKWHGLLTKKCNDILALSLDSSEEAYLRYHLGEVSYAFENETYAVAYTSYEDSLSVFDSLLALYHEGKLLQLPARPREPALKHDVSSEQFRTVLKKYPNDSLAHALHYSLAWCFNDQGMFDSAITHMQFLADNYPSSQYAPQAWMYLGEYLFDHAKLDRALKAYQSVMKYPESEWFDKALYKLAWTQYRLSNPEKAIGSFLALVDLGEGKRPGKTLLEKESIDYIAISFSETDATGEKGLARATNFVRRFGDPAKGAQILHRLATIFKEQGRFDMAQKTYATLLRTYPENQNSPLIESELLAVLEKNSSVEEANIGRVQFFNKYNKTSAWALTQSDPAIKGRGDSLACQLLFDAAISYHQLALQKNDTALYTTAADNYQTFIQNYPVSPHAGECHYNYAEILFSLGNYSKAAEEYIAVSKRYPDSKYRETAAWNAIVASQNLLKKESVMLR